MTAVKKQLREGFTTGTAAAAATKSALSFLFTGTEPKTIQVKLLTGDTCRIPVHTCVQDGTGAISTVIKDAGDDPDVTHRAEIGAKVMYDEAPETGVIISGGRGVGIMTKPGLEIPPGDWAINPCPRKMIAESVREALEHHQKTGRVHTVIFVTDGEKIAKKTLNARLGIIGGISILGTTGVVRPMSHDAYIATIASSLSVAKAVGVNQVVLTTGRRSERFARKLLAGLPDQSFIQIGDFFKTSAEFASQKGFDTVILAVFFGKALKMAQGIPHTHAGKSSMSLNLLSEWTKQITGNHEIADAVSSANTAREALDLIKTENPEIIACVGREMVRNAELFSDNTVTVRGIIFNFDGDVIFDSVS